MKFFSALISCGLLSGKLFKNFSKGSFFVKFNPDFVLILPWNIAEEVKSQLKKLVTKNTKFVTAVPELQIA